MIVFWRKSNAAVIWDNVAIHIAKEILEYWRDIKLHLRTIYLCSPWLNLVESYICSFKVNFVKNSELIGILILNSNNNFFIINVYYWLMSLSLMKKWVDWVTLIELYAYIRSYLNEVIKIIQVFIINVTKFNK